MTFLNKSTFICNLIKKSKSWQFFFVIALSIFVIFYQFNQIPKNLSYDEIEFAKLALSLDRRPYIPYSPQATGHSTLYFYILLFSLKIFGVSNLALRFPSALFGVLNVVIFYLILKKVFIFRNKSLSSIFYFISSTIFLTSHWYFNFARFAFEATFLLFLELMSLYFLFQCFKTLKWHFLILSGLFAGLAFNSYPPGRIFFLLPLGSFIIKKHWQNLILSLLLFLIPFIITITPLSIYLLKNKDIRIEQQFFLKNRQLSAKKKAEFLAANIKSTALMFNFKGDINGRHNYPGKPALNPILGILFFIGFFIAMKQWNNDNNRLFFFYFLISIFPTLMTYPWENPNMLRTFTVIPSVIYFISISLTFLIKFFKNKKSLLFIIYSLLFISSLYELRTYFVYQKKVFSQAFEVKYDLQKALKMPSLP